MAGKESKDKRQDQDHEGRDFDARLTALREEALKLLEDLEQRSEPQPPAVQDIRPARDTAPARIAAPLPTSSPVIAGTSNSATDTTYLDASGASGALYVVGDPGGVTGVGFSQPGLRGYGYDSNAVHGYAVPPNGQAGVRGESPSGDGVYGYSTQGRGTLGVSLRGTGMLAFSRDREALNAYSVDGDGIRAATRSGSAAVLAENGSESPGGVAVVCLGQHGTGVYASGAHAAIQLGRSQLSGAPTTGFHVAGELVLDANADLYLCKVTGTPGTWKFAA
ncbi:hypothetical protein [Streptomyces sp. NPDC088360]|uniref:hypothetical protein n=1 Tax=Streptomyces sp. NPDC088360 TaxID=3154515 RepID=UPI00344F0926